MKFDLHSECELCASSGGEIIWKDGFCRVVLIEDPDYPGFCRVILNDHFKEMTDLTQEDQTRLMRVVFAVEKAIRHAINPYKINLASLGNKTAHIHWHVIPRFEDDKTFPLSIWSDLNKLHQSHPLEGHSIETLKNLINAYLNQ